MVMPSQTDLTNAIADAARRAFSSLFAEHPGRFYYCTLITTGEALAPFVSAWSREALAEATNSATDPKHAVLYKKWSYCDSPYFNYGYEYFDEVRRLFLERPRMDHETTEADWDAEYQLRLDAMEAAMARLNGEGLFGIGEARNGVVVLVEVVPPDSTNTDRAKRLNPAEALTDWLLEAAEE